MTGGELHAAGHGVIGATEISSPYLAVGARLGWFVPFGSLGLLVEGEASAPLIQTALSLGDTVVWRTAPIVTALGVGIVASFL